MFKLTSLAKSYKSSTSLYRNFRQLSSVRSFATATEDDVVVIGGGPGGYIGAIRAAQLGFKVSCVESRGKLGGTCLNVGCIPSKALLNSSHKFAEAKHFADHGLKISGEVSVDVPNLIKIKQKRVDGLTSGVESLFKKYGVKYVKGKGTIVGPNEVAVEGPSGEKSSIKTKNIVIATGSEVTPVPGITIDEKKIISSTGALELQSVPKSMMVIGGGVIGLELGSVWSRFGSKVQVVEFTERIAAGADAEVANAFQKILKKQGIDFKMSSKVTSAVVNSKGTVDVTIEDAKGGNVQKVEVDVVLVSVGRRPFTGGLGLDKVGVKLNKRGQVEVNDNYQTNVPSIYAIGDVIRGPMLAHKAEDEGVAVMENLKNGDGHVNYNSIPSVIYTWPELSSVGKTEEELKAENVKYKIGKFPFLANSRAKTNADTDGFVKVLTDAATDKILGAHIIGPDAGELIAELTLGMHYGAAARDIAYSTHAHPTLSEAVKEACLSAWDKPLNF